MVAWDCDCESSPLATAGQAAHCCARLPPTALQPPAAESLAVLQSQGRHVCLLITRDTGSICGMKRNNHVIVPEARFRLTQGQHKLSCYQVRPACLRAWVGGWGSRPPWRSRSPQSGLCRCCLHHRAALLWISGFPPFNPNTPS